MKFVILYTYLVLMVVGVACKNQPKEPTLGEQIRAERIRQHHSQAELAAAVGMSAEALSMIEDGLAEPIHEKIFAIQNYLNVRFAWDSASVRR